MRLAATITLISTLPLLVAASLVDDARIALPAIGGIALLGGIYCYVVRRKHPARGF